MNEKLTRRDLLAQDRSHLANERTFLSYLRTVLALLASAAVLIKFVNSTASMALALLLIFFGAMLFIYSIISFLKYREKINSR